jgi:hypothetical protein
MIDQSEFGKWLRAQKDRDDPVGHLAGNSLRDARFPWPAGDPETIRRHLWRRRHLRRSIDVTALGVAAWRRDVDSARQTGRTPIVRCRPMTRKARHPQDAFVHAAHPVGAAELTSRAP